MRTAETAETPGGLDVFVTGGTPEDARWSGGWWRPATAAPPDPLRDRGRQPCWR